MKQVQDKVQGDRKRLFQQPVSAETLHAEFLLEVSKLFQCIFRG
jgi:hypothetical protein